MKTLLFLLLLTTSICKPAAAPEQECDWMGNPLPSHAQKNLLMPSQEELTQRLQDKGLLVLVGADVIKKIAGKRTSSLDVNSDVLDELQKKFPAREGRRRSIVNCLLKEHPEITQRLWQEEDKIYKMLGIHTGK